jgi:DNA-nicking Smr family endonuclease
LMLLLILCSRSHCFIILRTMIEDEEILFQQEMAGVEPLKTTVRVSLKQPETTAETAQARRAAAVADNTDRNPLVADAIAPLDSWYVMDFKRPGVQNGVFRKLKQGRYESEARLNLHRVRVETARTELFEFINQAENLGLRSLIIVHGKGENSRNQAQSSIIKGCIDHWLRQLEVVQAFHSARPQHGGTGAVYVLLRKNEQAKQENRQRFLPGSA